MNEVYVTDTFQELCNSCEKIEQLWIEKMKDQLRENLLVGKPLHFNWFREKKFGGKRLYFLTNESTGKVVLVAFGTKKEQQRIIDHVLLNKECYLRMIT